MVAASSPTAADLRPVETAAAVCGLEPWRYVFRMGLAPGLTTDHLRAVREGLLADDPALLQGATTQPPPLSCVQDWPCEGGCLISYGGWKGGGLKTVGEVEEFFAFHCHETDERLGVPAGTRHLLNWFDDTPRRVVLAELLAEVDLALAGRAATQEAA